MLLLTGPIETSVLWKHSHRDWSASTVPHPTACITTDSGQRKLQGLNWPFLFVLRIMEFAVLIDSRAGTPPRWSVRSPPDRRRNAAMLCESIGLQCDCSKRMFSLTYRFYKLNIVQFVICIHSSATNKQNINLRFNYIAVSDWNVACWSVGGCYTYRLQRL